MNSELKDWIQAVSWLAGTAGAVVAAYKFRAELRLSRKQRERDLRWKHAEAAKTLTNSMLEDKESRLALEMLDGDGIEFKLLPSKQKVVVSHVDLRRAFDQQNPSLGPPWRDIRYCFDKLFYHFALMENHIKSTLVFHKDLEFPVSYYVALLAHLRPEIEAYLQRKELRQPRVFLERYSAWQQAPKVRTKSG